MILIDSENTWLLLFIIMGTVALAVWLESRYRWAARVSALVIVLVMSVFFSNIHLIPEQAPVYDCVWDYFLPISLPLLLFRSDIRKICRESGQMLIAFLIGSVGTVIGAFVSYFIFRNYINELPGLAAMMTGTYIGGSVNFAVLGSAFNVSGQTISAATIADNLNMAIYFFVLFAIPVKAKTVTNEKDRNIASESESEDNEFTLKKFAVGIALSVTIVAFSGLIANAFGHVIPSSNILFSALKSMLGNQYLWITTFSVLIATVFSKKVKKLAVLQPVGIFFIYCFMFVIGAPASVEEIVKKSPLMLIFAMIIVVFNMLFTFVVGALFKMDRKTLIIASNANIGGPTTAASMAIAKGWNELVGPAVLIGCLGYVIGNYLGIIVGNLLM